MFDEPESPFLTIDETAKLLRVKRRTLDNLRWSGDGPPPRRHGGRVVYHRRDVLEWSERRRARTPPPNGAQKKPPRPDGDAGSQPSGDLVPAGASPTPPGKPKP